MAKAETKPTTTLTRRTALALAAGASAAAAVTTAAATATIPIGDDPVFAAIEAHKRAYKALDDFLKDHALIEQAAWKTESPEAAAALDASHEREAARGEELSDVEWALAQTVPATAVGVLAIFEYQRFLRSKGSDLFFGDGIEDEFALSIETALRDLFFPDAPNPLRPRPAPRPNHRTAADHLSA